MKAPDSKAKVGAPLMGFAEDSDNFRMPHITTTRNNAGEKIARTEVNGKVYEARHPYDAGRAAEALGNEIAKLQREGKLATGIL